MQVKNHSIRQLKANIAAILRDFDALLNLGIDPDCPNCEGTGGALPNGACGVCWNWYGNEVWEHYAVQAEQAK